MSNRLPPKDAARNHGAMNRAVPIHAAADVTVVIVPVASVTSSVTSSATRAAPKVNATNRVHLYPKHHAPRSRGVTAMTRTMISTICVRQSVRRSAPANRRSIRAKLLENCGTMRISQRARATLTCSESLMKSLAARRPSNGMLNRWTMNRTAMVRTVTIRIMASRVKANRAPLTKEKAGRRVIVRAAVVVVAGGAQAAAPMAPRARLPVPVQEKKASRLTPSRVAREFRVPKRMTTLHVPAVAAVAAAAGVLAMTSLHGQLRARTIFVPPPMIRKIWRRFVRAKPILMKMTMPKISITSTCTAM